jgi:flavin reductase (DIM6/NTAB) family NADH-FMN oxidoreductase RutF
MHATTLLEREPHMDEAAKKTVLRLFNYVLCVVTVPAPGGGHGFTANWIAQAAFEPPMISITVENDSRAIGLLRQGGVFAVNVLPSGTRELAGQLGRRSRTNPDKFLGVVTEPGATGCPLLVEALGHVECRVRGELPAGDHTLFLGEVVEAGIRREGAPLTMTESGFRYFG